MALPTTLAVGPVTAKAWWWPGLTGLVLGLVAVAADALPTGVGRLLIVMASTGLSWAIAAVIWGALSPTSTSAAVSGFVVLVGAVTIYYVTIGTFALRDTTNSALLTTGTTWAVVGAAGGLICGWLGWFARNGRSRSRALAVGGLGGTFMSQGVFVAWSAATVGEFPPYLVLFLAVALGVPFAAVVAVSRRDGLAFALPAMAAVAAITGVAWAGVMARV